MEKENHYTSTDSPQDTGPRPEEPDTYELDIERAHVMTNAEDSLRTDAAEYRKQAREIVNRVGSTGSREDDITERQEYERGLLHGNGPVPLNIDEARLQAAEKAVKYADQRDYYADEEGEKAGERYDRGQEILKSMESEPNKE